MKTKKKIITLMVSLVLLLSLLCVNSVLAGDNALSGLITQLDTARINADISDIRDPINVMRVVLSAVIGLVGFIFLILIIFSGVMWMTSRGNEERVTKAKNILISSSIGIGIIIFSGLIAYQITTVLEKETIKQ